VFSDQHDAVGWLHEHLPAQRSAYLLPGDAIDLGGLGIMHDAHWADFSLAGPAAERRSYLEAYAARSRDAIDRAWRANPPPAADLGERFAAHLESLGLLSRYFLARIGMTLRFEVRGAVEGVWDAHIGPDGVRVDLDGGRGPADYRLSLDGRWLDGVVSGRTRWEELLLSLRFSARREPDVYNDYLVGLLKHADRAALRAVEDFESARDTRQTVTVDVAGAPVRISRYCPHAGEDLAETSVVRDGRLRCLGHNFEFDLATGECLNARCEPLMVQHASPVG
jgi:UDP-MurNAc hydroxylase